MQLKLDSLLTEHDLLTAEATLQDRALAQIQCKYHNDGNILTTNIEN